MYLASKTRRETCYAWRFAYLVAFVPTLKGFYKKPRHQEHVVDLPQRYGRISSSLLRTVIHSSPRSPFVNNCTLTCRRFCGNSWNGWNVIL